MRRAESLVVLALVASLASQANGTTVITGATLVDGTGRQPLRDAVVVVDGERIRAVGARGTIPSPHGADTLDASGKFIIPGLIDGHCHLERVGLGSLGELPARWQGADERRRLALADARLDLLSGVTTVRDLGSTDLLFQVRRDIESGAEIGPRILAAGHQLVRRAPGAYMDSTFVEYAGPAEARERVRHEVALGADWIKIRLTHRSVRPLPSLEEMRAIVQEAHRLGRRVAVHTDVPDDEAVRLAIDAGVNSIEHNAALRAKDEHILPLMAGKGIGLMAGAGGFYVQRFDTVEAKDLLDPTARSILPQEVQSALLAVVDSLHAQTRQMERNGWDPHQVQSRFIGEMQRARRAGVLLIFGTDGGAELMVSGRQHRALYGETQMGSSATEALLMATRDAAKLLGKQKELGTVEPHKLADLVILDADPLADIRNVSRVSAVMKGGRLYRPAGLRGAGEGLRPATGAR